MTADSCNVRPVGKIIVRGNPVLQTEKQLTAPACSGMLAAVDGSDGYAKPCSSPLRPAGWISYEHTDYKIRPDDYETPYRTGDPVMVVAGGSFEIYALVSAGDEQVTITGGEYLAAGDGGMLCVYTPSADAYPPVARACESVTVSAGKSARVHVLSLI